MKLLSLNVALFEKNNKQLSDFLSQENADILMLQEVVKRVDESAEQDFISKDAIDLVSSHLKHSFYAPVWVLSNFEKNDFHGYDHFKFDLGGKVEFGNYLKSKFEITSGENIFVQNHFCYTKDWSKWPEEDSRAVQISDTIIDNKKLRLLNYHGIWSKDKFGNAKTQRACEIIKAKALEFDGPSIICGDFNLFPDTKSMNVFENDFISLVDQYNIKTTRPHTNELSDKERNVVDYVLVSKGIKVNDFRVINSDVSDHLPLVLDFDLS
jgi:endonuclease/exonuclease/phosphatase family metal-dependent hydrolase